MQTTPPAAEQDQACGEEDQESQAREQARDFSGIGEKIARLLLDSGFGAGWHGRGDGDSPKTARDGLYAGDGRRCPCHGGFS